MSSVSQVKRARMVERRNYGAMDDRELESDGKINESDDKINQTTVDVPAPEEKSVDILGSIWGLLKLAIPLCLSSASWVREYYYKETMKMAFLQE